MKTTIINLSFAATLCACTVAYAETTENNINSMQAKSSATDIECYQSGKLVIEESGLNNISNNSSGSLYATRQDGKRIAIMSIGSAPNALCRMVERTNKR